MTTHFWAVPKIGTPAIQIDIDPEALGRNYPLQAARQRRRQGDARADAGACRQGDARPSARPGSSRRRRSARSGTRNTSRRSNPTRCRSGPSASATSCRKHVPDDAIVVVDTGHAGMWMGGMYDLRTPNAELHAQRRPSRLGVPGRARRQMRRARAAGGDVHRRRRLLVPHRRDRDGGALEDQRRHGGQQQRRRQPVQARLRPRLWRHSRPSRRASCGPSARSTSRASPRTWARSASGSRTPSEFPAALAQALAANRPAVIDVVTDIDALAPMAVA